MLDEYYYKLSAKVETSCLLYSNLNKTLVQTLQIGLIWACMYAKIINYDYVTR